MNKTQLKKLDKYKDELESAKQLIIDSGFILKDDMYVFYEKSWSKDKQEIYFGFKDSYNRHFCATRYKTGWGIYISKSCKYRFDECNFDKFIFTDKVYYAFLGGSGSLDMFKKAPFETCLKTFLDNYEEAHRKVDTEVLTVKWTKGIGTHSHTYPSGEGVFYTNISREYNKKHP